MASVHRAERASPDHAHSSDNARHNPPAYRPNRVLACASDVFLASGMKLRHAMLAALIAIAPPLAAQPPAADADAGQSRDPLAANLGLPIQNGALNTGALGYNPGGPGDIVVLRIYYQYPVYVNLLGFNLSNLTGGYDLFAATAVFKNEPYASS